jgi:hypothetical protein
VPDWVGDFQNPDFPALFAGYAGAFARRYPWVQLHTPVNEMFVCATFSALYGWWNEQLTTDRGFVTALKHLVQANVLAMAAILEVRPDAIFVQSESSEYFHADDPAAIKPAEFANARRFLSLDLNYGRRVGSEMYEYLMDNGMTREEYHFFLRQAPLRHHCVMGNDYYVTNEHRVAADGRTRAAGEVFGYDEITRQYHDRYKLPVMHTETNLSEGSRRRRGRGLALEAVGERAARAQHRRAGRGLHLVLADRPGRLGRGAARGERPGQPARPLRPRPQHPRGRPGLQAADRGLGRRAAGAERVPERARGAPERDRRAVRAAPPRVAAALPRAPARAAPEPTADDSGET